MVVIETGDSAGVEIIRYRDAPKARVALIRNGFRAFQPVAPQRAIRDHDDKGRRLNGPAKDHAHRLFCSQLLARQDPDRRRTGAGAHHRAKIVAARIFRPIGCINSPVQHGIDGFEPDLTGLARRNDLARLLPDRRLIPTRRISSMLARRR